MTIKSGLSRILIAAAFLFCSCAPTPYAFLQYGPELRPTDLSKVLAENPLAPSEDIKLTNLGRGQAMSHHVVQIRTRESPHLHKAHDATVLMIRGKGYLIMYDKRIQLSATDVVYIPRGAPHYFVNTGPEPAAALVVFSPPFDGKDNFPLPVSPK